jgi:integrase
VRQKKTGQPVRFEMTEQTREAVDNYIAAANKKPGQFLFGGRCSENLPITTRQYSRLVDQWIASIGLDPSFFGTHSRRRTNATLIYRRTGNLRAVQLLLGSISTCARWRIPAVVGYAAVCFRGMKRDAVPGMSIHGRQASM